MIKPGNAGLGATKPDEPLPGDDEFDVYRKRMMLAYKYRPNPMVGHQTINNLLITMVHSTRNFCENEATFALALLARIQAKIDRQMEIN